MKQTAEAKEKENMISREAKAILGGDFLLRKQVTQWAPYLIFLTVIAMFYIANNYQAEKSMREISQTHKDLKELRYEYISTKSRLMKVMRQSELSKTLESKGIKESTEPVKKLHEGR